MLYQVEKKAHAKMVLHALKNAHTAVNGVLIGTSTADKVTVADAFPLFHTRLMLPAMTEVALAQSAAYSDEKGLEIVGYYHGDECVGKNGTLSMPTDNTNATVIANKIHDKCRSACVLMLNNGNFKAPFDSVLQLLTKQDNGGWVNSVQGKNSTLEADSSATSEAVNANLYRQLVDFDDHLEDVSLDWLNTDLAV